jgi:hypothetical protein
MKFLQQRVRIYGLRLLHAKVLSHIGLWVVEVAAVVRMTKEVAVAEVAALLQQARMR